MNLKKLALVITLFLIAGRMYSQTTLFLENTTSSLYLGCTTGEEPNFTLNIGTSIADDNNVIINWFKRPASGGNPVLVMDDLIGSKVSGSHNGEFKLMFKSQGLTVDDNGPFDGKLLSNHPSGSHAFMTEGTFFAVITLERISTGGSVDYTSNDVSFTFGYAPSFCLNSILDLNANKRNEITLFSGCDNGDIILKLTNTQTCATDGFSLAITKKDINGNYIGNTFQRPLTSTELTNIKGSGATGISIKTLNSNVTGGSNNGSITITEDNWYVIELIYVGQGVYKPRRISLHYKSGNWDLVLNDNLNASYIGYEPTYIWDNDVYRSPDLWNKLSTTSSPSDGVHENPDFIPTSSTSGHTNKMMFKVTNLGCVSSPAGVPVRLYWTRARTDELYANHWLFNPSNMVYSQNYAMNVPAGSEITINSPSVSSPYNASSNPYTGLPTISAGTTYTLPFANGINWFPPDPLGYDGLNGSMSGNSHPIICFLARINEATSTSDPIIWEPTGTTDKINPYVKNNNNVATRNSWLVDDPAFLVVHPTTNTFDHGYGTVLVNNPAVTSKTVNICVDLIPDSYTTGTFANHGTINIGTTTGLYNLWVSGGQSATNVSIVSPTSFLISSGTHACLNNITLPAGTSEQIGLKFNYNSSLLPSTPRSFSYQLSQYSVNNTDTIINNEDTTYGSNAVYIVNVPTSTPEAPAFMSGISDKKLNNENLILYPNPSNDMVSISMFNPTGGSTQLTIIDSRGEIIKTYDYQNIGAFIETVDTKLLPSGVYIVNFKNNYGTETKKLTVIH